MLAKIKEWWNELRLREQFAFIFMGIMFTVLTLFALPVAIGIILVFSFFGSLCTIVFYLLEKSEE